MARAHLWPYGEQFRTLHSKRWTKGKIFRNAISQKCAKSAPTLLHRNSCARDSKFLHEFVKVNVILDHNKSVFGQFSNRKRVKDTPRIGNTMNGFLPFAAIAKSSAAFSGENIFTATSGAVFARKRPRNYQRGAHPIRTGVCFSMWFSFWW